VPDPDRIVACFRDEFEKLLWITLMVPWEGEGQEKKPRRRGK